MAESKCAKCANAKCKCKCEMQMRNVQMAKSKCAAKAEVAVACSCSSPCLRRCPKDGAAWWMGLKECPVCGGRPCEARTIPGKVRSVLNKAILKDGSYIKKTAVWNLFYGEWETLSHPDLGITECELVRVIDVMNKLEDEDNKDFNIRGQTVSIHNTPFTCVASCCHSQMYDVPIMVLTYVKRPPTWEDDEDAIKKEDAKHDDKIGGIMVTKTHKFVIFAFHGKLGNPGDALQIVAELTLRLRDDQM